MFETTNQLWKITIFHGRIHYCISMVIFHSYVKLPEGTLLGYELVELVQLVT
jgi:hypothetical protein